MCSQCVPNVFLMCSKERTPGTLYFCVCVCVCRYLTKDQKVCIYIYMYIIYTDIRKNNRCVIYIYICNYTHEKKRTTGMLCIHLRNTLETHKKLAHREQHVCFMYKQQR